MAMSETVDSEKAHRKRPYIGRSKGPTYSVYEMYYNVGMTKKTRDKVLTFRPDPDMFDGMQRLREVHGTPYGEQLRRALRAWLAEQPAAWVQAKKATLRAATRQRRTR